MNIKRVLVLSFSLLVAKQTLAIDPVYEGPDGIRTTVFVTNCLACHSSDKVGADRNGAPPEVNFDTYEAAEPNAERAIVRAVDEMTMPPASSGIPMLTEDQKTAMRAWQSAGFPQDAASHNASFDGTTLIVPILNIGGEKFHAIFTATPYTETASNPTGYAFMLNSAVPTSASSDKAATFIPETGRMLLPSVDLIQNGAVQGSGDAEMRWITGSAPMLFVLESPRVPKVSAPATYDGHFLTLPLVDVGNPNVNGTIAGYHAILRQVPLLASPFGVGFKLEKLEQTRQSPDNAAIYDLETGQIDLPEIKLVQNGVRRGLMQVNMTLVPGSDPLLFSVTDFSVVPGAPW
jgi:hypothetical protein